jgi:hypothetical protein
LDQEVSKVKLDNKEQLVLKANKVLLDKRVLEEDRVILVSRV